MRTRPVARGLAAVGVGTALLALPGCTGSDRPERAGGDVAATARPGVVSEHGPADVAFVQGLHPRHEDALTMAELATTRAGDPRVSALAARIAAAQRPELVRLEALATAWRVTLTGGAEQEQHGGTDDAAVLQGLSGPEFDRQFLSRMLAHHEGALPLARDELARGTNPDARALATQVLAAQQAEAEQMQQLLTGL